MAMALMRVSKKMSEKKGKAMPLKVSERGQMAPFMVMDVLYAANQRASLGSMVYHLEIGQPGTGAPREVIEAIQELDYLSRKHGYTDAFGITPLRDAIVEHYKSSYGLSIGNLAEPVAVAVVPLPGSFWHFLQHSILAIGLRWPPWVPLLHPLYLRPLVSSLLFLKRHLRTVFNPHQKN